MKLRWFLLSLTSIFLLSSPVKANPNTNQVESANGGRGNQSDLQLPELKFIPPTPNTNQVDTTNGGRGNQSDLQLPELKFIPPTPSSNFVNPTDIPKYTGIVPLGREILELKTSIKALMARYRYLTPGIFFMDLQTGNYLNINGGQAFSAASTIKYPILIALFQEVDTGRIKLSETLVMQRKHVTGGSGDMQYRRVGTKISLLDTVTKMMTISDNTATNMIISRLGGKANLNQRFRTWGLQNTVINNMLGDFKGTNKTSAKDLVRLSALIANNQLISDTSRSQVLGIMIHCHNKSLLPSGLGYGASIAHKTGTLRFVLGDAGIIETPSGKRYLAGIFVRRPNNDDRATAFIRQVSQIVYGYFEQPKVSHLP